MNSSTIIYTDGFPLFDSTARDKLDVEKQSAALLLIIVEIHTRRPNDQKLPILS